MVVMIWAEKAATGTGSIVFSDYVTAGSSSRINCECRDGSSLLEFKQMPPNSSDGGSSYSKTHSRTNRTNIFVIKSLKTLN